MIFKLLLLLFISQIFYLGVFSETPESRYVVNIDENLCGEFTRGDSENPNWLQSPWFAVSENIGLSESFFSEIECENNTIEKCCKALGYRYAGIPIGVKNISSERKAGEFIASKNIIQQHSLYPSRYNLDGRITRKEAMKVIINTSGININSQCRETFADVELDWGCKYIETALDNSYIAGNEQFRPNGYLTQAEALKLIFKARNIEKSYASNSWQDDYISTALYLGFIESKFSNYNIPTTRGWFFSVLAKTYPDFKNY